MLSTGAAIAAIAVMAIVTFLTRVLPFLLFDRGSHPPSWCSTWAGYSPRPSSPCSSSTACGG